MSHLLIIDDDLELCQMLSEYLLLEGFEVSIAQDGENAITQVNTSQFDLIILDIMLPKINGIEILKRLRVDYFIPIIMLTAKGEDIDRVVGLELGADDYLPKPCNPRELVARIRAILRRTATVTIAPKFPNMNILAGQLQLKLTKRIAIWRGCTLELTSTEFNILETLAARSGTLISKNELSECALGRKLQRYDRSIDMHISHLRQKLGVLNNDRSPIQTVRGQGYQFITDDSSTE